jgi:hypothetical protein
MLRYVAAVVALVFLALAFFAKSAGVLGFALLISALATITSLVGFVDARISASAKSEIYVPTAEERALLAKRQERQRDEHARRRDEGQRLEPDAPGMARSARVARPANVTPPSGGESGSS